MLAAKESLAIARGLARRVAGSRMRPGLAVAIVLVLLMPLVVLGAARPAFAAEDVATPYRTVVLLDVRFPAECGTCTWFIVGPHTVATAGHCLYNADIGGGALSAGVIPGSNGVDAPFDRQTATVFEVARGCTQTADPALDYGAITLASDLLGIAAGQFELSLQPDARLHEGSFETGATPPARSGGRSGAWRSAR